MSEQMFLYYFTRDQSFPFFIQYGEHSDSLPQHVHRDFTELVIVLKGSAIHQVNGDGYPIAKGDAFVIGGEASHGYHHINDLKICNIMFQTPFLEGCAVDLARLPGYRALFLPDTSLPTECQYKSRLHLSVPEQLQAESLIRAMVAEYQGGVQPGVPGSRTLVIARFMELVVLLSRWYENLATPSLGGPLHLARAVALMETRYAEKLDLEEIASQAGLSVRHFSRLFKASYGMSPMHYLQRLRLRQACALLERSDVNITEVALSCGFGDSNLFSRQFRQALGLAPSDWRKRCG
jgi:AraC-like DNA-binding protein